MQGIYEIVNLSDGRATAYVGGSRDIEERWQQHVRALRRGDHRNAHLQRAWDKYGEGAFVFSILEEVKESDRLLAVEQGYLARYLGWGSCYNIARDASAPMLGRTFTEEHRRKIGKANSKALRGRTLSEEHRRKLNESRKGRRHTEEARRKMSEANKGRKHGPMSEEHKHKISEACKGKLKSKEHRHKIGKANAGAYPAFIHQVTGEIIPAGVNLTALCRERGLERGNMCAVTLGKRISHNRWVLA